MEFDFSLLFPAIFMFFWLFFVLMIVRSVFKNGKGLVQLFQKGRMVDGKFVLGASDDLPPAVKKFLQGDSDDVEDEDETDEDDPETALAAPDIFSQLRKSSFPAKANQPISISSRSIYTGENGVTNNKSPIGKEEGSSAFALVLLLIALIAAGTAWYFLG